MSHSAIVIENLSKRYLIGHRHSPDANYKYISLRDAIGREARNFARKAADFGRGRQVVQGDEIEDFWALKNVSFEIKEGEVFGIIGRNGSGKSTLLKILSRITEPTEGRVLLRGRVSSLLEVGTGFHPELTGRENIFLNGAILGMPQREIQRKFDEIVAFAEVEKFLDTPVKHYSSGMYVRLAFAVAAHLEPDILIVDEVLAVGDASFQEKCLGKMNKVAAEGRTILFVSHNMSALMQLTTTAVVLSHGSIDFIGQPRQAVERYTGAKQSAQTLEFNVRDAPRRHKGTGDAKITTLRFDRPAPYFDFLEPIRYTVRVKAERDIEQLRIGMTIFSRDGSPVGSCFSPELSGFSAGNERELIVQMESARLAPGEYYCAVSAGRGTHRNSFVDYDVVTDVLLFEVGAEKTDSGALTYWGNWGAISFPDLLIKPIERRS